MLLSPWRNAAEGVPYSPCIGYDTRMFFSPRIPLRKLAELSHRLDTALAAGIDMRTIWTREASRARGGARRQVQAVSKAINRGESMEQSLAAAGTYFPLLFRELAAVGDVTGHQSEVFKQLAEHYDHQAALRRNFLASLAWPIAEFVIAALIVGFMIWIMGAISATQGKTIDPLGLGLLGNRGLAIYASVLCGAAILIWLIVHAVRGGLTWARPLQRALLLLPFVGPALETLCLARLAWSLHLTLKAGMDVFRSLRLSLQSTRNARYIDQIDKIIRKIKSGKSLFDAFSEAGNYPNEFLDALAVSEQSGRVVESMELLSRQYQERARSALGAIAMLAGLAVWIVVAVIIVAVILRLGLFYIRSLGEMLK
jgi:type IV pilus assembly protein PilC